MSTKAKRDIEYATHETAKVVFWTPVAVTDITKTLKLYEESLIVSMAGAAAATVTLPNVAEAKGLTFDILVRTAGAELTIADNNDSEDWTDYTIEDANDHQSLRSDGVRWIDVAGAEAD